MNPILTTFMQALDSKFINNAHIDNGILVFDCNTKLDCSDCPYDVHCNFDNNFILQDLITQHHPELLI